MTTSLFQPMMESRPIREIAYEVLKHAIITGEIPAGERIVETDYAERLHISRTPLRRIPTSTTLSRGASCSMISWAMRVSARWMPSPFISCALGIPPAIPAPPCAT